MSNSLCHWDSHGWSSSRPARNGVISSVDSAVLVKYVARACACSRWSQPERRMVELAAAASVNGLAQGGVRAALAEVDADAGGLGQVAVAGEVAGPGGPGVEGLPL